MFFKFYQMTFLFLLTAGTIIAISSSSWFTSWVGLELNLMMMIPLIMSKFNSMSTEATIKYFLVQAMSSALLLIFSMLSFFFLKLNYFFSSELLILLPLLIKSGIPPFHFWFPQVMEMIFWKQCFIMISWQKIAPLVLISMIFTNFIMLFIIMSSVVGALGGFNQNSMKKIITYSSIIHSGWMMSIIIFNLKMWMNYFIIYSCISACLISMLFLFNIEFLKEMMMNKMIFFYKMIFSMNLLSLAGLPPFLGFFGKFMIITFLTSMNMSKMILTILIISSVLGLFFYMKMVYSLIMINSHHLVLTPSPMSYKNNFMSVFSIYINAILPLLIILT